MTEDTCTTPEPRRHSILPRRGGLPVAARRGGPSVAPRRGGLSVAPRRGGLSVAHRPVAGGKETAVASLSGAVDLRGALTRPPIRADLRDAGLACLDAGATHPSTRAGLCDAGLACLDAGANHPSTRAGLSDAGLACRDAGANRPGAGVIPLGAAAVTVTAVGSSEHWSGAVSSAHAVGDVTMLSEQAFLEVWIVGAGETRWTRDRPHTFGELDPVTVSEIIRDLREVMQ
ncbi:hypothetical protein AB0K00_47055 [Dactylosporangium sp. NPDC049525]|uniref:hypothetical protein n=1 Tax=Dactylosporangium sp. NPDC049525 TaxID=3154730 RepID=UPI00342307A5